MYTLVKRPSHLAILNYYPGDLPEIEMAFTYREVWTTHTIGMLYDEESRELRIFGGANPYYLQKIANTGLEIVEDLCFDKYEPISLRLKNFPRDQLQNEMIQFLIAGGKYQYTYNFPQIACNAQTGEGKTFCAIAMITYLRMKTIIILSRVNIKNNWISEIQSFTDIDHRRILLLDSKNIDKILSGKLNTSQYVVYVAIHRTICNAAKKYGWKVIGELFKLCSIGLKIYDEAHKEFNSTMHIDAYTNTRKTLYLTATLKIAGRQANWIFQRAFREIPKFDQKELGYNNSKKHIIAVIERYDSKPDIEDRTECKDRHGFNARKHSLYQIDRDRYFYDIFDSTVEKFTIRNSMRTLILLNRVIACETIAERLRRMYPDKKIATWHHKVKQVDKDRAKEEADIIVSTNQSLGMGETIKDLRCVINCEAFFTDTLGFQASGRLRRLESKEFCYYIELIDEGFPSIKNQWKARKKEYLSLFNQVMEIDLRGKF